MPSSFPRSEGGPDQWGASETIGGRDPARCRRVAGLVVKRLGRLRAEDHRARYLQLLQRIADAESPALARLVDGGIAQEDGERWMATAWAEGRTAREEVEAGGVDAVEMVRILRPVAEGLARMHAHGLVHRDVSPGNVIVTEDGGVLIDYGQTILIEDGAPPSRGVVGTPGFVAPEEVLEGGAAVAPPVDVFGLAAVGYALVTGAPPARGEDVLDVLAQAAALPPRPSELCVDMPESIDLVLMRGLAREPTERPSAADFARSLQLARAGLVQ